MAATIIGTTRGKLTIPNAAIDAAKITAIIDYIKAEPDLDVTNGVGFGSLQSRITSIKVIFIANDKRCSHNHIVFNICQ